MKDLIITLVIIIALSVYFSCLDHRPIETAIHDGYGAMHKGNSGPVIPGDGDQLAAVDISPQSVPEPSEDELREDRPAEKAEATQAIKQVTSEESTQEHSEEVKEEQNKMGDMVIVFWHGVAAVLIGESAALMVAIAFMKIKGGKNHD